MDVKIKNVEALHRAIAAVAPIDGVSADGVKIWFQEGATQEQIAAARAVAERYIDPPDTFVDRPPPLQELPTPKAITDL
jgi:hypothetical protein